MFNFMCNYVLTYQLLSLDQVMNDVTFVRKFEFYHWCYSYSSETLAVFLQRQSESTKEEVDDRSGWLFHPTKGTVSTYIFEEQRNVHCYFDDISGQWVQLPLTLELQSESIQRLVNEVQVSICKFVCVYTKSSLNSSFTCFTIPCFCDRACALI